jgi:hypothetical protein
LQYINGTYDDCDPVNLEVPQVFSQNPIYLPDGTLYWTDYGEEIQCEEYAPYGWSMWKYTIVGPAYATLEDCAAVCETIG